MDIDDLGLKKVVCFLLPYPNKFLFPTLKFFLPSKLPINVKHA